MSGGSLQAQIDDNKTIKQIDDVAVVAYSMLNALNEMHKRNIVHRDIKPGKQYIAEAIVIPLLILFIIRKHLN